MRDDKRHRRTSKDLLTADINIILISSITSNLYDSRVIYIIFKFRQLLASNSALVLSVLGISFFV